MGKKVVLLVLSLFVFMSCEEEDVEKTLAEELLNTRWSLAISSLDFKFFEFTNDFYIVQSRTGDRVSVGKYTVSGSTITLDGFGTIDVESKGENQARFTISKDGDIKVSLANKLRIKRRISKRKNFVNVWQTESDGRTSVLVFTEYGFVVFAKVDKNGVFKRGQLKTWFWDDDSESAFCVSSHRSTSCRSNSIYEIERLSSNEMILNHLNSNSKERFLNYYKK